MRTITAAMAIMATSVTIASFAALPAHAVTTCTAATIIGGFGIFPIVAPNAGAEGSGLFTFDGARRVTGREIDVYNNGTITQTNIKGEYKVKSDCSMTMIISYYNVGSGTLNRKTTFDGVIVNGGTKIDTIATAQATYTLGPAPFVLESVQ